MDSKLSTYGSLISNQGTWRVKEMLKKITSLIAVAVLSGTVSANVHAAADTATGEEAKVELSQLQNTLLQVFQQNSDKEDSKKEGSQPEVAATKHLIKEGETLWLIAQEYKVTVEQIMDWNELTSDLIHPGMELSIQVEEAVGSVPNSVTEKTKQDTPENEASESQATEPELKEDKPKPVAKKKKNKKQLPTPPTARDAPELPKRELI
jgi:LysM repeat protein